MKNFEDCPKFSFCVEVSADFAEFTSKKDERMTYPVPTSGAVRGMLEAIFWKPAIRYIVKKIEVLNPIQYMNIKKNEIKNGFNANGSPIVIDNNDEKSMRNRIQRNNVYLRNIKYRIYADLVFMPKRYRLSKYHRYEYHEGENPQKYYEILKRRIDKGQFKHSPFLGTRECRCDVDWIDENSPAVEPIHQDMNLGMMYVDYIYFEDYFDSEIDDIIKIVENETGKKVKTIKDKKNDTVKIDDKSFELLYKPRPVVAPIKMVNGTIEYPSKYDLKEDMLEQMKMYWNK